MAFATAATRAAVAPMRLATVVTMSLVLWDMGQLPSRFCAQIGHRKTLESRPAPTFTHQKEEAENPHHDLIL